MQKHFKLLIEEEQWRCEQPSAVLRESEHDIQPIIEGAEKERHYFCVEAMRKL
jgi:hypothetical protein